MEVTTVRLIALLLAFACCCLPLSACDVNLFAIMAGSTKQDAFSESTTRLAQAVKDLGDNYMFADQAEPLLNNLMTRWVEFSGSFNQFPPDWGKSDPNWNSKFTDLGSIIGEVRRQLASDTVRAHAEMLKFSRRLPWLYEFMPMSDRARLLLEFTRVFDGLWQAFYAQDLGKLKQYALELGARSSELQAMLADSEKELAVVLAERAEQVRVMSTQLNAFKTMTLQMTLSAAEAEFVSLNEKLSAAIRKPEEQHANPSGN